MTVKGLRASTGLTQEAFCKLTGIPRRTLQQWESGEHLPPDYVLKFLQFWLENKGWEK